MGGSALRYMGRFMGASPYKYKVKANCRSWIKKELELAFSFLHILDGADVTLNACNILIDLVEKLLH